MRECRRTRGYGVSLWLVLGATMLLGVAAAAQEPASPLQEVIRRYLDARDHGQYEQAVTIVEDALALAPQDPSVLGLGGEAYCNAQRWVRAVEVLRQALQLGSSNSVDRANLIKALARTGAERLVRGEVADGRRLFEEASALLPGDAWPDTQIGDALADLGEYGVALLHYEAALRLNPKSGYAYGQKAAALAAVGELAAAERAYRAAIKAEPQDGWDYTALARLLKQQGRVLEALQAYADGVGNSPTNAGLRYDYGDLLVQTGRFDEARVQLQALARLGEQDLATQAVLTEAYFRMRRPEDCVAQARRALALAPDLDFLHALYVLALSRLGTLEEATQRCEQLLAAEPQDPDAQFAMSSLYRRQERLQEAAAAAQAGLQLSQRSPWQLREAADVLYCSGNLEAARTLWHEALTADPQDAETAQALVTSYLQEGRFAEGLAELREVLAAGNEDEGLQDLATWLEQIVDTPIPEGPSPVAWEPPVRQVSVLAMADEEFREAPDWRQDIERRITFASAEFERSLGIALDLVAVREWDSRDEADSLSELADEADREAPPEIADLVIAFTAQQILNEDAVGLAGHLGERVIVLDLRRSTWNDDSKHFTLLHELCHIFGAVHAEAEDTVMRRSVGGPATLVLDDLNRHALLITRSRHFNDGIASLGRPALEKLLAVYRAMAERYPEAADPRSSAVDILLALGRRDEALEEARRAYERDPQDTGYLLRYAMLLQQAGRGEEARGLLAQATEADENVTLAVSAVEMGLGEAGDLGRAERVAQQAAETDVQDGWVRLDLAGVQLAEEKYDAAAATALQAVATEPEDPFLRDEAASLLAEAKHPDEAIQQAQEATRLDQNDFRHHMSLANAYDLAHRPAEAISTYEEALRLAPDNSLVCNNFAYTLVEADQQLERALELVLKATERRPDDEAYVDTLGWIYYKLGRYEEAVEQLQRAAGMPMQYGETYFHLGMALQKVGRAADALAAFERAIQVDPEMDEAQEAQRMIEELKAALPAQPTPAS